jgi:hypothetical protein
MEYLYSPFPLLAVMSKTRTSRTVRDALMDYLCLNSNGKNTKSAAIRGARWIGRTVRQDPADCPPGPRGPLARYARAAHRSVCFEINFGPSAEDT